jgi:hypothetical protein
MKFLAAMLVLLVATPLASQPSSTAFTYQGQLNHAGEPAVGDFDFQFVLFDSPDFVSAVQLAGPVTVQDHPVDSGLFAVQVDFGANAFGSMDVWLEIRIREGDSVGPFTTLAPREKVTPVPLALHAFEVELGAVGSEQLASGAVGTEQIADASIAGSDVDPGQIQLRIDNICPEGSAIRVIDSDGTVTCEPDNDTTYVAGFGLGLASEVLSVDTNSVQARITGTCTSGQFMVGVNSDGTVQCAGLPVDCSLELVCPTPVGGKSCLSGRLSDAQDSTPLESSIAPGSPCDGGAEGGPCDLTLEVHDALSFASDSAGSPFGLVTFAEHGALLATFSKDGVPVPGVTVTRNGLAVPADDYYFSDPGADSRTTISPAQTMTGANGAALVTDSGLIDHSGTGGESGGCVWSEELADTIAGVVTVADFNCN